MFSNKIYTYKRNGEIKSIHSSLEAMARAIEADILTNKPLLDTRIILEAMKPTEGTYGLCEAIYDKCIDDYYNLGVRLAFEERACSAYDYALNAMYEDLKRIEEGSYKRHIKTI